MAFKTKSYFCLTLFFHSRIVKEVKSDNSQFPIILAIVKNFSFKCTFWITNWRANNEQSNFLEQNQIWSVYHWLQRQQVLLRSKCLVLDKRKRTLGLRKSALTKTTKALRKLLAGSGKILQFTCGDFCLHPRVISPVEQDTCSHRR